MAIEPAPENWWAAYVTAFEKNGKKKGKLPLPFTAPNLQCAHNSPRTTLPYNGPFQIGKNDARWPNNAGVFIGFQDVKSNDPFDWRVVYAKVSKADRVLFRVYPYNFLGEKRPGGTIKGRKSAPIAPHKIFYRAGIDLDDYIQTAKFEVERVMALKEALGQNADVQWRNETMDIRGIYKLSALPGFDAVK